MTDAAAHRLLSDESLQRAMEDLGGRAAGGRRLEDAQARVEAVKKAAGTDAAAKKALSNDAIMKALSNDAAARVLANDCSRGCMPISCG